ncbi:MAG: hypothetical protein ACRDFX_03340 [Chloroflexota bacterium]
MMQSTTPLIDAEDLDITQSAVINGKRTSTATIWVSRVTSVLGLICLALALIEWAWRPGHLRTVLAFLIVAMFAAILRSYSFEDLG